MSAYYSSSPSRSTLVTSSHASYHGSIWFSGCCRPWSPIIVCSMVMVHPLVESAMPFHRRRVRVWWTRILASLSAARQRHWMWLNVSAGWQKRAQAADPTCGAQLSREMHQQWTGAPASLCAKLAEIFISASTLLSVFWP
jgi:hypothetical protein